MNMEFPLPSLRLISRTRSLYVLYFCMIFLMLHEFNYKVFPLQKPDLPGNCDFKLSMTTDFFTGDM
jgi:hypothetical protein